VTVASAAWLWIHTGFMVSLICGVFLVFSLLAVYLDRGGGLPGFIGSAMAVVSLMFVFGLDYSEVFIFPTLATEYPEVVERYGDGTSMPSVAFAFPVTGLVFLIGFVLFPYELFKRQVVDLKTAVTTIGGTIIFAAGLSGQFPMFVVRAGSVVFGAGLILLGLSLWRMGSR
jgi:hypothetical protein